MRNKILLIDLDSKIPNLALKKIELYHKNLKDEVVYNVPLFKDCVDKIYVSCVFDWNKDKCSEWDGVAEIGGSGYDLIKTLPNDIEQLNPKINLGFTTRGCIRNCYFCIVPKKEGKIRIVGDIYDLWDGKAKELIILDNNILAVPDHFKLVSNQLLKENLKVDFNQGLDHRLLTPEICELLLKLKHIQEIRFSYDDIGYRNSVEKALDMLKKAGMRDWKSRWYIYVSEKDTFETVYERMIYLRERKQTVFVMPDHKVRSNIEIQALYTWGNVMGAFKMATFKEILNHKRFKKFKDHFDKRDIAG